MLYKVCQRHTSIPLKQGCSFVQLFLCWLVVCVFVLHCVGARKKQALKTLWKLVQKGSNRHGSVLWMKQGKIMIYSYKWWCVSLCSKLYGYPHKIIQLKWEVLSHPTAGVFTYFTTFWRTILIRRFPQEVDYFCFSFLYCWDGVLWLFVTYLSFFNSVTVKTLQNFLCHRSHHEKCQSQALQ